MSDSGMSFLSTHFPWEWISLLIIGSVALAIGSFLNVVIYRLPLVLERKTQAEARQILRIDIPSHTRFDLAFPRSHCPECNGVILPRHNIPLVSWFILRGKCFVCSRTIPLRYPLIEGATCILAFLTISIWGYSISSLLYFVFLASLLALLVIDAQTNLLPDQITLPLMWLGLLASYQSVDTSTFPAPMSSIVGAIIGYGSLWLINQVFKLVRGQNGMGNGDFKLVAALGAWLGWQALPTVILISSILGLSYALFQIRLGKLSKKQAIPFGPFLSIGGCVTLIGIDFVTIFFSH